MSTVKEKPGKTKKALISIIIIVFIGLVLFLFLRNNKESVDISYCNQLLSTSSELTTAKLNTTGFYKYKDEGVSFVDRSDFAMVYNVTIRAGINMAEVKITADDANKVVHITIPKASIIDVTVDSNNIEYYDTKFSLFNMDQKEDSDKAQSLARDDAKAKAPDTGILELADQQAETLVKGILINAIPDDYQIKVN